ncbi:MAG: carboxypeptidase regulatory-like domain-containing protein [Gemmataceae bacterium]
MRNYRFTVILGVSLSLTAFPATGAEPALTGQIVGVVRYIDAVGPPQVITTTDGSQLRHFDLIVDGETKGLRYVVAILEDAPEQPKADKAKPVIMDQVDMVFTPRVLATQHGQKVIFENNDICNHSVMTISPVRANQFNVVAGPGQPISHVFEKQARPVMVGCSLHGWMRGWVYVVPHPWFAVTDAKGKFHITNVPPGRYTLLLAHADSNRHERRRIEVQPGQTTEVTIDWKDAKK